MPGLGSLSFLSGDDQLGMILLVRHCEDITFFLVFKHLFNILAIFVIVNVSVQYKQCISISKRSISMY